jgi:hypothetical protein
LFALSGLTTILIAASLVASDPDNVLTHDYVACAAADDLPICLLQQRQRSPYDRPLSESPIFAGASDIVALIETGTAPLEEDDGDRRFRLMQQEPNRLRQGAMTQVHSNFAQGLSVSETLNPIRITALGRDAIEFMNGQIHVNSGAEIRVAAYRQVHREFSDPEQHASSAGNALALAAVQAWEVELAEGRGISTYHNPRLGWGAVVQAYAALNDEAGLRSAYPHLLEHPMTLVDEVRVLLMLGRADDARSAIANFSTRSQSQVQERVQAEHELIQQSMLSSDPALRGEAVDFYLRLCGEIEPPNDSRIIDMMDGRPEQQVNELAMCFAERGASFTDIGARSARLAFDLWESIAETERADSLMTAWHAFALRENELRACPGERHLCAKPFYQYMLGRRDRVSEGFEFSGFTATQALQLDLDNNRGLVHLDAYDTLTRQASDIDLALSYCVHRLHIDSAINLSVATNCARALNSRSGLREPTEHEWRIMRLTPSLPPRGEWGPYRVATTALRLAAAAAQEDQMELADEMLEVAFDVWARLPDASPATGAEFDVEKIAIALLRQQGRLAPAE